MNRCLLGEGADNALAYINHLIPLDILEVPSGTAVETWTVPDEWIVNDAWVKFKGKKIIDYKKNPLSLVVGSLPFSGKVTLEELSKHLHYSDEEVDEYPYIQRYYDKDWGVTLPKSKVYKDKKLILKKGEYEVFIDTEYRPGVMKTGVHTIKGKTDKEILLFAHIDHPYQANNNLSGVACLIDLVKKIKPEQQDHTIKLIFCAGTIGSIHYALTQDLSKVSFVIALDSIGNPHPEGFLLQKTMLKSERINDVAYLALRGMGKGYRNAAFRSSIGSDEYAFNDPEVNVPALMLTAFGYNEYETSADTPDKIDYQMLEDAQTFLLRTIDYYEKDYTPSRKFRGPLYRSKYKLQTGGKKLNLSWDYLFYSIDGKKTISKLCNDFGLNFEYTTERLETLIADDTISRGPIVG